MGIISGLSTLFKLISLLKTVWAALRSIQSEFKKRAMDEAHKKVDSATDVLKSPEATKKEREDAIKRIADNSF